MNPKLVVLAALVVLVLLVIWAQNSVYRSEQRRRRYARRLYSGLQFRTGDLLLFDSSAFNAPIKWATLSPYSHAGVVLMVGGVPHIAEISRPGVPVLRKTAIPASAGGKVLPPSAFERVPPGTTVLPLALRLRDYPGRAFVARLDRPLSAAQEEKIARAAFDDNRKFATPLDQIAGAGLGLWRPRSLHCCQHVNRMLNAAGAHRNGKPLPETALIGSMRAISNPDEIHFPGGARFSPPVEILYDLSASS